MEDEARILKQRIEVLPLGERRRHRQERIGQEHDEGEEAELH